MFLKFGGTSRKLSQENDGREKTGTIILKLTEITMNN